MAEFEAPVRLSPFRRRLAFGLPLVDRREAAPEEHLAAKLELLGCLEAGINPARGLQPVEFAFVEVEPLRLANDRIQLEAQPFEVVTDRPVEFLCRALAIGVVDAQDELARMTLRKEEIVQRRPDVADV